MTTVRRSRRGVALMLTAAALLAVAGGPVRGQDVPKPLDASIGVCLAPVGPVRPRSSRTS